MERPLFSVIVPTHDRPAVLAEARKSVWGTEQYAS